MFTVNKKECLFLDTFVSERNIYNQNLSMVIGLLLNKGIS